MEYTGFDAPAKAEAIARLMIDKFGSRALEVAEAQAQSALPDQNDVTAAWLKIASLIREKLVQLG